MKEWGEEKETQSWGKEEEAWHGWKKYDNLKKSQRWE